MADKSSKSKVCAKLMVSRGWSSIVWFWFLMVWKHMQWDDAAFRDWSLIAATILMYINVALFLIGLVGTFVWAVSDDWS